VLKRTTPRQAPSLNALVWGVMRRGGTSAALLLGKPDIRHWPTA